MTALEDFRGEMWSLFGLAAAFTSLRLFARIRAVGFRDLQLDDYLTFVAMFFYAAETGIASYGGSLFYAHGGKAIEPQKLVALPPGHPARKIWAMGAKLHFASWPLYDTTLWLLKMSLLVLFSRLTVRLSGSYRSRVMFGFIFIAVSWVVVVITPFVTCRPLSGYWTIDPYPTNECQAAVSRPIVWITYAFNVATDLYLMSIPLPMLWETTMKTWKKIGLGILFSGGLIVVIFATVRCVLIATDPKNGAPVAGTWAVRETFVAVITANIPMAFTLVKGLLGPTFRSIRSASQTEPKAEINVNQLETFGSGSKQSRRSRGNPTVTNMIFSESEERMVYGGDSPHLSGDTLAPDGGRLRRKDEES